MYVKEVFHSPFVQTNEQHTALLSRLIRAIADGDGDLGMRMIGNVGANRVLASCYGGVRIIEQIVFQRSSSFEGIRKSYSNPWARSQKICLTNRLCMANDFTPYQVHSDF